MPRPPRLSSNDAVGRAVPPHPGPLPRGEGEPFGSAIKGHRLLSFPARSKKAPSPWGEGRGEGERDVRTAWIRLREYRANGSGKSGCFSHAIIESALIPQAYSSPPRPGTLKKSWLPLIPTMVDPLP